MSDRRRRQLQRTPPSSPPAERSRARGFGRFTLLLGHAGIVVVLTVAQYYLRGLSGPDDGVDIGAGIALEPLIPLGLPWSLPVVVDRFVVPFLPIAHYQWPYPTWTLVVDDLAFMGPAYVNVLLHGVLLLRSGRGAVRQPPSA